MNNLRWQETGWVVYIPYTCVMKIQAGWFQVLESLELDRYNFIGLVYKFNPLDAS